MIGGFVVRKTHKEGVPLEIPSARGESPRPYLKVTMFLREDTFKEGKYHFTLKGEPKASMIPQVVFFSPTHNAIAALKQVNLDELKDLYYTKC